MRKPTEISSTKSSSISSKAASLKKSVKKGAKVLAQPFKKLKTSISAVASRSSGSIRLIRSQSPSMAPGNTGDDFDDGRSHRSGSDGDQSDSEPEGDLSPEAQLGALHKIFCLNHLN